jgi:hypothetical protein
MTRTIWKYPLKITDEQTIDIPEYGEILSVQVQNSDPCIWVLVNPTEETEPRVFEIFGTGHPLEVDLAVSREFIGTFQQHGGVWHLFEKI